VNHSQYIKRKVKKKLKIKKQVFLFFQARFEKVNFLSLLLIPHRTRSHIKVHSRSIFLYRCCSRELSCHCRSEVSRLFLLLRANACRRRPTTVNERPRERWREERREEEEKAQRCICTRVIRKRQSPRAAWALSSKNKQNVAPRYGLTRVYIARIADIAGRFSLVLSFSLAVIPFHFLFLFWFSPLYLSFSLRKKLGLVHVRARDEICCIFHADSRQENMNITLFTKAGWILDKEKNIYKKHEIKFDIIIQNN